MGSTATKVIYKLKIVKPCLSMEKHSKHSKQTA